MKESISVISRIALIAIFILIRFAPVQAQSTLPGSKTAISAPKQAVDDRAPITVRNPSADKLADFRTDRDYQYDYDTRPPENPLAKFWAWIQQKISEFFRSKAYQNFWQYAILVAIAGVVIWLLIKAEVLAFMFPKRASNMPLDYENITENIHEINFDASIEEAIQQHNYRQAIRLAYLQTLKQLTDKKLIDWKPDKTNRQYLYELMNTPLQADFDRLTTQFEFVWYGDFPVDEARFRQFATDRLSMMNRG